MRTSGRRDEGMLRSYERPSMDEVVDEALREYSAKREAELPDGVE